MGDVNWELTAKHREMHFRYMRLARHGMSHKVDPNRIAHFVEKATYFGLRGGLRLSR